MNTRIAMIIILVLGLTAHVPAQDDGLDAGVAKTLEAVLSQDDPSARAAEVWKTCEPQDLMPRQGCEIYLRRRSDGSFAGETRGTGCSSRIGDAE